VNNYKLNTAVEKIKISKIPAHTCEAIATIEPGVSLLFTDPSQYHGATGSSQTLAPRLPKAG
jgi:hypothetical protein